ncbi:hypothetical protein [Aequorivita capsosiphonis]|uniref:hypothetical protein n=1 Tax=Aequorivita capsosiphonis TaxID=487317 RepID=UPI0004072310|nr:hypothetical protein [Aequorivita capsosiphonis]
MKKIAILLSLLILFGCLEDDSNSEESEAQDPNAIIADNVVVILAENSELISADLELESGLYKIRFNETPPEIEVNDIIVGDEGLGFLRKVVSISSSNNVLTMQTDQANMEDVFGNTNINFSTDLPTFNRLSSSNSSQRLNYENFGQGVSRRDDFTLDFANVEISSNAYADLKITSGSLTFNPMFEFDLDYSFFSLDRFEFVSENAELNTELTLNLTANAGTTIPITEYILYENSKTFVKPIGNIPVVATVYLKVKATSEIETAGTLSLSKKLEHNTILNLGATYENDTWTTIADIDPNFVNHPVELGSSYINVNEKIAIVPEVIIAFYGINGPKIDPILSGNFGVNVGASQDWDAYLNAKFDINLGASIGILGETLISLPFIPYNIYTQPIWNAPDSIELISGDNQTGNQGEELANPLKVRIVDNSGLFYLKNVPVHFNVASGNGTIDNQIVMTDSNGYAEVAWTLGETNENQTVEATVKKANGTTIGSVVTFNASTGIDLSGEWLLTITNCSDCAQDVLLIFNSNGSVTYSHPELNRDLTVNNYSLNGDSLTISYTQLTEHCEGEVISQYISQKNLNFEFDSNKFLGTDSIQIIGGSNSDGSCVVGSESFTDQIILSKQ